MRAKGGTAFYPGPNFIQYLLSLKPAAYWPLNDPVGSAKVKDLSGNGNDGTVNGGVVLGEPGGLGIVQQTCALFEGANGLITTPYVLPGGPATILCLFKETVIQPFYSRMLSNDDYPNYGFWLSFAQNTYSPVELNAIDNVADRAITNNVTNNEWHLSIGTYDGATTIKLNTDGTIVSGGLSSTLIDSPLGYAIGGQPSAGSYYQGYLQQAAIFERVLTSLEQARLNALRSYV